MSEKPHGPAASLAPMVRPSGWADTPEERAYPLEGEADAEGLSVVVAAVRALLRADSRPEAAAVLHTAVRDLSGLLVPATESNEWTVPIDVSLGVTEPLLVATGHLTDAKRKRIERQLPRLVEDALYVANRCDLTSRRLHRAGGGTQVAATSLDDEGGDTA